MLQSQVESFKKLPPDQLSDYFLPIYYTISNIETEGNLKYLKYLKQTENDLKAARQENTILDQFITEFDTIQSKTEIKRDSRDKRKYTQIDRNYVKELCANKQILSNPPPSTPEASPDTNPDRLGNQVDPSLWCYTNLYSSGAIVETDINQMFQTVFSEFDPNRQMLDIDLKASEGANVSKWSVNMSQSKVYHMQKYLDFLIQALVFDKDKQIKSRPKAYNDPQDLLNTAFKVLREIMIKKSNTEGTDRESNHITNRAQFIIKLLKLAQGKEIRMIFQRVQAELVLMHTNHGQSINHLYEDLVNLSSAFTQNDLIIDKFEFSHLFQQDQAKYHLKNDEKQEISNHIKIDKNLKKVKEKSIDNLESQSKKCLAKEYILNSNKKFTYQDFTNQDYNDFQDDFQEKQEDWKFKKQNQIEFLNASFSPYLSNNWDQQKNLLMQKIENQVGSQIVGNKNLKQLIIYAFLDSDLNNQRKQQIDSNLDQKIEENHLNQTITTLFDQIYFDSMINFDSKTQANLDKFKNEHNINQIDSNDPKITNLYKILNNEILSQMPRIKDININFSKQLQFDIWPLLNSDNRLLVNPNQVFKNFDLCNNLNNPSSYLCVDDISQQPTVDTKESDYEYWFYFISIPKDQDTKLITKSQSQINFLKKAKYLKQISDNRIDYNKRYNFNLKSEINKSKIKEIGNKNQIQEALLSNKPLYNLYQILFYNDIIKSKHLELLNLNKPININQNNYCEVVKTFKLIHSSCMPYSLSMWIQELWYKVMDFKESIISSNEEQIMKKLENQFNKLVKSQKQLAKSGQKKDIQEGFKKLDGKLIQIFEAEFVSKNQMNSCEKPKIRNFKDWGHKYLDINCINTFDQFVQNFNSNDKKDKLQISSMYEMLYQTMANIIENYGSISNDSQQTSFADNFEAFMYIIFDQTGGFYSNKGFDGFGGERTTLPELKVPLISQFECLISQLFEYEIKLSNQGKVSDKRQ